MRHAPNLPLVTTPSATPDPARLSREVFALAARCDAGFTDVAERLGSVEAALATLSARIDQAEARADALERAAAADRLAAAAVLDPLDDLLALVRTRPDATALLAMLEPLAASQLAALARAGIDEIPAAAGTAFDPRLHDGVGTGVAGVGVSPGSVVDVIRRGFQWRGAVLRRAQVVIAVADAPTNR